MGLKGSAEVSRSLMRFYEICWGLLRFVQFYRGLQRSGGDFRSAEALRPAEVC